MGRQQQQQAPRVVTSIHGGLELIGHTSALHHPKLYYECPTHGTSLES